MGVVYGRPTEVPKPPICNKDSLRKREAGNLSFLGRIGVDSNTPRALGEHLPWRVATVVVWLSSAKYEEL